MTDRPTYIAICAGLGIGCEGLREAGWRLVAAIEASAFRRAAIADRFTGVQLFSDLRQVRGSELPRADYWIATLPCQSFSRARDLSRTRTGLDHATGSLWFSLLGLICEARAAGTAPKRLFFENVEGLVGCRRGWDWRTIKATAEATGLRLLQQQVVDARDLGVPQRRRRLLACWEVLASPWLGC